MNAANTIEIGDLVVVSIRKDIGYTCESYRGELEEIQEGKKGTMLLLRLVNRDGSPVIRERDQTQAYRSLPMVSINSVRRNGRFVSCDV